MSGEVKHTEGPWQYVGDPSDYGEPDVTHGYIKTSALDGSMHIAVVVADGIPEHRANGHLLAAAPEMLEALIALENAARILPPHMDVPGSPLAKARAAIAKATGEKS